MRPKPTFDACKGDAVLTRLVDAIASNAGIAAERGDLVENQVPAGVDVGSREHANFLFLTVPCDRGTKSSTLWQRAKRLYADRCVIYDIQAIASGAVSECDLSDLLLSTLKPRYAKPAARYWMANASRLYREFAGDARELFGRGADASCVYRLIRTFDGFGPKTGGMMLRAAVGLGWASGSGIEAVEMPVDVHDARISFYTGVMSFGAPVDAEIDPAEAAAFATPVRRFLTTACARRGISWPEIDRVLWLIGSRGCARRRCSECPLCDLCRIPAQLPLFRSSAG